MTKAVGWTDDANDKIAVTKIPSLEDHMNEIGCLVGFFCRCCYLFLISFVIISFFYCWLQVSFPSATTCLQGLDRIMLSCC